MPINNDEVFIKMFRTAVVTENLCPNCLARISFSTNNGDDLFCPKCGYDCWTDFDEYSQNRAENEW